MVKVTGARLSGDRIMWKRRGYGISPPGKGFVWNRAKLRAAGSKIGGSIGPAKNVGKNTKPPLDLFTPGSEFKTRVQVS